LRIDNDRRIPQLHVMWAEADDCGRGANNLGQVAFNPGLAPFSVAINSGRNRRSLRVEVPMIAGHYSYSVNSIPLLSQSVAPRFVSVSANQSGAF
jgi:hypothetical protein